MIQARLFPARVNSILAALNKIKLGLRLLGLIAAEPNVIPLGFYCTWDSCSGGSRPRGFPWGATNSTWLRLCIFLCSLVMWIMFLVLSLSGGNLARWKLICFSLKKRDTEFSCMHPATLGLPMTFRHAIGLISHMLEDGHAEAFPNHCNIRHSV